ncbi:MAG: LptE family protein [Rikenellaceae bacterium]
MRSNVLKFFILAVVSVTLVSCAYRINYTLSGASIPPEAKTFSVAYFPNNATMVAPTLSSEMTNSLKNIFMTRTRLTEVTEGGDFAFEGEITNYTSTTASVSSSTTNDYGSLNRLTITVKVRFTNVIDEKSSFNKSFSAFTDYDSTILLTSIESELIATILEEIIDDIFQEAASNW